MARTYSNARGVRRSRPAPASSGPSLRSSRVTADLVRKRQRSRRRKLSMMGGAHIGRQYLPGAEPNRLLADVPATPIPINEVLRQELKTVRARSRHQAQSNDYVRRFLEMLRSNVIGPQGIRLQADIRTQDGGKDVDANAALENAWIEWTEERNTCDLRQELDFVGIERQFITTCGQDGENVVRLHRGTSVNEWGFALEMIDPELLDVAARRIGTNRNNTVDLGVETDELGRRVAYHFLQTVPGGSFLTPWGYVSRGHKRVEAFEIEHSFLRDHAGQRRGIPWTSTSLFHLAMLNGYDEAAITAARVGAAKVGFISTPTGEGYTGTSSEGIGGDQRLEAEPGVFEQIAADTEVQTWDPTYPHEMYSPFRKAMLRGIASGLGISYNTLASDLEGVSYSSIRAGRLDDLDVWKMLQLWTIREFHKRIFSAWLDAALMTGKIRGLVGRFGIENAAQIRAGVKWRPRGWTFIDPLKDTMAHDRAVNMRIRSRGDIIREGGREPQEVWDELAAEAKMLEDMGIAPVTTPGGEAIPTNDDDGPGNRPREGGE